MAATRTVGLFDAAKLIGGGISPQCLAYRALVAQRVRVASRKPLRFHLADLLDPAIRAELQRRDPRGKRSNLELERILA